MSAHRVEMRVAAKVTPIDPPAGVQRIPLPVGTGDCAFAMDSRDLDSIPDRDRQGISTIGFLDQHKPLGRHRRCIPAVSGGEQNRQFGAGSRNNRASSRPLRRPGMTMSDRTSSIAGSCSRTASAASACAASTGR